MLETGFAKVDITPDTPMPLGGYFFVKERISDGVRDPLYVRALALSNGDQRLVILAYDILLVSDEMVSGVRAQIEDENTRVILFATHTHSSFGGYMDMVITRFILGKYRPGVLKNLCESGSKAAKVAIDNLCETSIRQYTGKISEIAKNRRDEKGLVEDTLVSTVFETTDGKKSVLTGFAGHPVIVAERAYNKISADFPGEVVKKLEKDADFAIFINGPLAGVDVFFPDEEISVDENLELQASPIIKEAKKTNDSTLLKDSGFFAKNRQIKLKQKPAIKIAFDNQPWAKITSWPLEKLLNAVFSQNRPDTWNIEGFAIGDLLVIGTPAEVSATIAKALREYARSKGFSNIFVASHCGGYLGYMHRKDDYGKVPSDETKWMAMYENSMGIYGHSMGETLIREAKMLIDDLGAEL